MAVTRERRVEKRLIGGLRSAAMKLSPSQSNSGAILSDGVTLVVSPPIPLFVIGGPRGSHGRGRQMGPDAAFWFRAAQR
eukprot:4265413-Prymnesium_polylepis.1